jgi:hypothetical protein
MKIYLPLFLFFCVAMHIQAQTLRGSVRMQDTYALVIGAQATFTAYDGHTYTTTTGMDGKFSFDALPIGTGALTVEQKGCVAFRLTEIIIAGGKEKVVDVLLTEGFVEAASLPIEIVEARPLRQVMPLGEIPLSREQTLYNPMTYFDPARLAMAFPGVAQTDDGTNSMSIRGNNPALVRWKLNGMDIVSPNHLPNAGTISDRPTSSSGGVMMISAQMLDNSALITGAGVTGYNDGIAGIMDLNLRKGNDQKHEQTIQAGLIGIDAAAEGPLSRKRNGGSYLINYRYSTVGILGALGVSFGGEKVNFQDIALHLNFPTKRGGSWSIFALGGLSTNVFTPPDSATTYKELFNINFESKTGLAGVSYTGFSRKGFSAKIGATASHQFNDRVQFTPTTLQASEYQKETRLSLNASMRYKLNSTNVLVFGTNMSTDTYTNYERGNPLARDFYVDGNFVLQNWIANESTFLDGAVKIHYGINPVVSLYGSTIDPRLQAFWRPSTQHQFVLSAAAYSQMLPIWVTNSLNNTLLRSAIVSARYNYLPNTKWVLSAEFFNQSISNILISGTEKDGYSFINETTFEKYTDTKSDGVANNRGIELMAQRRQTDGWFMNANVTLLQSEYQGADQVKRQTRWSVGQIANLTSGKEWHRKIKKNLSGRVFGISGRTVYMGGYRTAPIDINRSVNDASTVFDLSNGYTGRNNPYFRVDGRVYWKRSIGNKRNSTIALEFQNLSAQKNVAFQYYDPLTKLVTTKYQLGMIPNFSWRLEM